MQRHGVYKEKQCIKTKEPHKCRSIGAREEVIERRFGSKK
jgi:hypothetical protein